MEQKSNGVDLREFLTANFLKSADVVDTPEWVIVGSDVADLPDGKKAVLNLENKGNKKDLVLNSTNIKALMAAFGFPKTSEMVGKKLVLKVVETMYKGTAVDGIRVDVMPTRRANGLSAFVTEKVKM